MSLSSFITSRAHVVAPPRGRVVDCAAEKAGRMKGHVYATPVERARAPGVDDDGCVVERDSLGHTEKHQNLKHLLTSFLDVHITKGQLISEGLFKVFICTKNEQKYFCILF